MYLLQSVTFHTLNLIWATQLMFQCCVSKILTVCLTCCCRYVSVEFDELCFRQNILLGISLLIEIPIEFSLQLMKPRHNYRSINIFNVCSSSLACRFKTHFFYIIRNLSTYFNFWTSFRWVWLLNFVWQKAAFCFTKKKKWYCVQR